MDPAPFVFGIKEWAVVLAFVSMSALAHDGPERHPLPVEWEKARADLDELANAVTQLRQSVESIGDDVRELGSAPAIAPGIEKAESARAAVEQMAEPSDQQPVPQADIPARWLGGLAAAASILALLLGVLRNRLPRPPVAPDDTEPRPSEPDDEENTNTTKEQTEVAKVIETGSKLRFEIRKAENGHPYFAVVFTSNGKVLAASQPYVSGMDPLEKAISRLRAEAAGATEEDVRHKGPIKGAAPPD